MSTDYPPIDYNRVFQDLPSVMGLNMTFKYGRWNAPYYIDGRHSERSDKMVCKMLKGKVGVMEQGGEHMSLWDWMLKYGGCKDNGEVARRLVNGRSPLPLKTQADNVFLSEGKYVDWSEVEYRERGEPQDNLFYFLASKFGTKRVKEVYKQYHVGNARLYGHTATMFWAIDGNGRVCHDSWIKYDKTGHRIREKSGQGRFFKIKDGYTRNTYFGGHLKHDIPCIVESPKTALIMACRYPKSVFWATFGSTPYFEMWEEMKRMAAVEGDGRWKFFPDNDKAGDKWREELGDACADWVGYYRERGETVEYGEDVGDLVMRNRW